MEISVCTTDMSAILGVIGKYNIRHNALLADSCLMDSIKSLLEKHEITGGFYLGLVLTIGYECNCVIGSKFFVLAATHGSVIHACKLFEKLPYRDVVIWSSVFKNCACFCPINLVSYFFAHSSHFACLAFTFQSHQACPNVELMSTITFSHAKGSLQIFIDLQDTKTRHQAAHLHQRKQCWKCYCCSYGRPCS